MDCNNIVLEGHRLGMIRSERIIFRNINFTIQSGHNLLLVGQNGSGKSTLLKIIAGLITATEGKLIIKNNIHSKLIKHLNVHYLSDTVNFKPELTCYQNLIHLSYLLHPDNKDTFHKWNCLQSLDFMNLGSYVDYPTKYLSFGQLKRLSLAQLFLKECAVWILDEPTVGLDKKSLLLLSKIILEHNNRGGLTIISSHNNILLEQASLLELR